MSNKISRICDLIESVAEAGVCFGGDTIIDEYRYVKPLNKSPKENLVPVRWESTEAFKGGVEAAANHARSFVKEVQILSTGPITRKVRFVELPYLRKVFEFQHWDGKAERVGTHVDQPLLVITDFGHGEYRKDDRQFIANLPVYLAVNAQTNAANYGFNLITQWPRADYVVIDEPEARLAARDLESPIERVIEHLAEGRCRKFIVTMGTHGAVGFDGTRFARRPAFTKQVVDTMGAGDAFFAVTALMAKEGELEDLLVIGNAVGALKCGIIGHRNPVTKTALVEFLREHL